MPRLRGCPPEACQRLAEFLQKQRPGQVLQGLCLLYEVSHIWHERAVRLCRQNPRLVTFFCPWPVKFYISINWFHGFGCCLFQVLAFFCF